MSTSGFVTLSLSVCMSVCLYACMPVYRYVYVHNRLYKPQFYYEQTSTATQEPQHKTSTATQELQHKNRNLCKTSTQSKNHSTRTAAQAAKWTLLEQSTGFDRPQRNLQGQRRHFENKEKNLDSQKILCVHRPGHVEVGGNVRADKLPGKATSQQDCNWEDRRC